jgi:hypothetical protein
MDRDEFLWGGLRTRLERMGRVRPHTITQAAAGQRAERAHEQVRFRPAQPLLRPRVSAIAPTRGR